MKQTLKRFMGLMLVGILMLTCSFSTVLASEVATEQPQDMGEYLVTQSNQIVQQLAQFTDEQIEQMLASTDAFSVMAVEAWKQNKDELGAFVEITDSKLIESDGTYQVEMMTKFADQTAKIVMSYDETGIPTSMTMDVQYPLSYTLKMAALNTVMGVGTVFLMLLALAGIISLFKYLNVTKKKELEVTEDVTTQVVEISEEEYVDDLELVAVITAAIAASENKSTDSFVVRSIKRANHKNWQRA